MLTVGDKIPNLTGASINIPLVQLNNFRDKYLLIFFYPKDHTPGCISEACDFRDLYTELTNKNTVILGVSCDSLKSHRTFQIKHTLPFDLIADTDGEWCQAFGVIQEKQLSKRRHIGIIRSTFLIDPHGEICHEWRNIKVRGHAKMILSFLDELAK